MLHSLWNDSFHLFSAFIKLVPPAEVRHIKQICDQPMVWELWEFYTSALLFYFPWASSMRFLASNDRKTPFWSRWPSLKWPGCIWGRGSSRSGLCLFHHVDTTFFPSSSYLGFALWPRLLRGPKLRAALKSTLQPSDVGRRGGGGKEQNELPRCGHPGSRSHSAPVGFSVWHYRGN